MKSKILNMLKAMRNKRKYLDFKKKYIFQRKNSPQLLNIELTV